MEREKRRWFVMSISAVKVRVVSVLLITRCSYHHDDMETPSPSVYPGPPVNQDTLWPELIIRDNRNTRMPRNLENGTGRDGE
ncbi:hypothetical protein NHX12_031730 [Muraenolepis orangiensis]|uniref:Uncharacterized protein n=1 Tax=Muraenolepis orangiensis TaxID=630683 RepID=A0A9Q0E8E3_9TELE|nr:hypothetical protein NHX12_031730 [Muraenolepis orangiensis]